MPLQVQLQQGYSPHGVWVAKILRAAGEEFLEQESLRLGQQRGSARAVAVSQDSRVTVASVGGEPVVNSPRGHPQEVCDRRDRLA